MNHFFTALVCVSLGTSFFALSNDRAQFDALERNLANSECSSKCQGDFPTSGDRKYAAAGAVRDRADPRQRG